MSKLIKISPLPSVCLLCPATPGWYQYFLSNVCFAQPTETPITFITESGEYCCPFGVLPSTRTELMQEKNLYHQLRVQQHANYQETNKMVKEITLIKIRC